VSECSACGRQQLRVNECYELVTTEKVLTRVTAISGSDRPAAAVLTVYGVNSIYFTLAIIN